MRIWERVASTNRIPRGELKHFENTDLTKADLRFNQQNSERGIETCRMRGPRIDVRRLQPTEFREGN